MMLKFTNTFGSRKGDPLYLNRNWIVSVFEDPTEGGSLVTVIYGGMAGERWYVEEGLSEVIKIIDNGK